MHLKTTTYIRCFIDMSLYNNFNEENKAHELWEKIGIMLENKNVVNRVSVFRKIVRLKYQDSSSMAEHINAFQALINQTTSLEVPLANEVLALLLLGYHAGQRRTGGKTLIPGKGKVEPAKRISSLEGPGNRNRLEGLSRRN